MNAENLLFWTLCIGSAVIAIALAAEAFAGLKLLATAKMLRTSALQLSSTTARLSASVQQLIATAKPQVRTVSGDIKGSTHELSKIWCQARGSGLAFSSMLHRMRRKTQVFEWRTRRPSER